jgi:MFS transporter, putative metabolite transport protein
VRLVQTGSRVMQMSQKTAARTVQDYIDETPRWADGTALGSAPLTAMQWRIWMLAAAGKFFEGLVVFMTGVAIPLIGAEFSLNAIQHGVVGAASLFGILVGALVLGGLADTFGRKPLFIVEMIIFMLFLVVVALSPNFPWLVVGLFGLGLALGCDYPTAHMVISESIPSRLRGRLVLSAFGFQAVGALTGTALGYVILSLHPELGAWRWMYASAIVPAVVVLVGRFFITESAPWLITQGKISAARHEATRLLARAPPYPKEITLAANNLPASIPRQELGYRALLGPKVRRATILASVPWFLQDLSTYGIGIFTPTLLAATFGHVSAHPHGVASLIHGDILAARGAAFVDVLLIVGVVAAALLADRVGRIRLQIIGFIGCAAGLALAALSGDFSGTTRMVLIFSGFMLFNFMTNLGPNAQTYLLAGEVFPTRIRGKGAGLAAAIAKIGAVLTAFLFPILIADIGTSALLCGLIVASLLGAVLTYMFRIETTGVSLEKIGH